MWVCLVSDVAVSTAALSKMSVGISLQQPWVPSKK